MWYVRCLHVSQKQRRLKAAISALGIFRKKPTAFRLWVSLLLILLVAAV